MRRFSKSGIVQACSVTTSRPHRIHHRSQQNGAPHVPPPLSPSLRWTAPTTIHTRKSGRTQDLRRGFPKLLGRGHLTTGAFSLQFLSCVICYLWAAVSTPPYERLPPFSTPDDPRAGGQRKKWGRCLYPLREFGHRPSRGEAIWVHNPKLHGLALKKGYPHEKPFGNSAREIGQYASTLILSSLFCGMIWS